MNKKLLVTLLHKNLEELAVITAGFQEMNDYPQTIIQLARRKTEDIQTLLDELACLKTEQTQEQTTNRLTNRQEVIEQTQEPIISPTANEVTNQQAAQVQSEESTKQDSPDAAGKIDDLRQEDSLKFTIPPTQPFVKPSIANDSTLDDNSTAIDAAINVSEHQGLHETTEIPEQELSPKIAVDIEENITSATITEITIDELPTLITEESESIKSFDEKGTISETTLTCAAPLIEEPKKMTISEKIAMQSMSRNEAFANNNSLSSIIANKKISDLKQAISIGDRFRFQRELFKSNGEDMNRTLTYLNLLATQDEAMSFLKSKYGWGDENEAAEDFYQLVKRKFL